MPADKEEQQQNAERDDDQGVECPARTLAAPLAGMGEGRLGGNGHHKRC
jgi:hypothetical protein